MDFITSRLSQSSGELQNAQIMEVPLVMIHLLLLVIPVTPSVSVSMVSQWVSHPNSSLLSIPYLRHRNLWWSWQLLGPWHSHYCHPKILITGSHYLSQGVSLLTLSLSSTCSPYATFLGTKHISLMHLWPYQMQQGPPTSGCFSSLERNSLGKEQGAGYLLDVQEKVKMKIKNRYSASLQFHKSMYLLAIPGNSSVLLVTSAPSHVLCLSCLCLSGLSLTA